MFNMDQRAFDLLANTTITYEENYTVDIKGVPYDVILSIFQSAYIYESLQRRDYKLESVLAEPGSYNATSARENMISCEVDQRCVHYLHKLLEASTRDRSRIDMEKESITAISFNSWLDLKDRLASTPVDAEKYIAVEDAPLPKDKSKLALAKARLLLISSLASLGNASTMIRGVLNDNDACQIRFAIESVKKTIQNCKEMLEYLERHVAIVEGNKPKVKKIIHSPLEDAV